jgi:short-subunit dehydrogenase
MTAKYEGSAFRERFGPWAVVAGGSDGIGAAFARELARRGLDVVLIARREEPLEKCAAALRAEHGVETKTIAMDLTGADMSERVAAETADLDVGLFVYNAGSSRTTDEFLDLPESELHFILDRNCRGPLLLSHHFGARLARRGRGGLVLMSSVAGLAGSHYQALYCATKSFDTVFAEGLWHELAPRGVDVLAVIAAATKTETMLRSSGDFDDAMDPAEVATGALDHLGKGPSWVPGDPNRRTVRGLWPLPRVPVVNAMSRACAELFGLSHQAVAGREFDEDEG